jgi:hypothetical protein
LAYLGPDTFLRQQVFAQGRGYPHLSPPAARRLGLLLRVGFPLVVALCVTASVAVRAWPPAYLLPAAGVAVIGVSFHTRTRYRMAVVPALALWAADVIVEAVTVLRHAAAWWTPVTLVGAATLATLLARIDFGREREAGDPAVAIESPFANYGRADEQTV